jgi:MFS family permease
MRVIQGFSAAPLETLISATVSELFFAHEKGKMLSIWNLFVMGGVKLGCVTADRFPLFIVLTKGRQLIASFIIQNLGFKFTFGICALIYAGIIPLIYYFVPETVYFAPAAKTEVIFDKSSL